MIAGNLFEIPSSRNKHRESEPRTKSVPATKTSGFPTNDVETASHRALLFHLPQEDGNPAPTPLLTGAFQ
jgi:hypothetical protein